MQQLQGHADAGSHPHVPARQFVRPYQLVEQDIRPVFGIPRIVLWW